LRFGTSFKSWWASVLAGTAAVAPVQQNCNAKLTTRAVLAVLGSALPTKTLALRHGVSIATVNKIKARTAWAHIEVPA
jgi:hypothetical protein